MIASGSTGNVWDLEKSLNQVQIFVSPVKPINSGSNDCFGPFQVTDKNFHTPYALAPTISELPLGSLIRRAQTSCTDCALTISDIDKRFFASKRRRNGEKSLRAIFFLHFFVSWIQKTVSQYLKWLVCNRCRKFGPS